ncbi:MAG: YqaA family protein [Pseudooceanicola sp.]
METWSLLTLFAAAFGAATVLPFQSEIVFAALQLREAAPIGALIVVASVGNTLGAVLNLWLGRWIESGRDRPWFPASEAQLERARGWYARWGVWSLLLSWAPLGDAITVVAGVMRTPMRVFLPLVALAKTGRYVALAAATEGLFG